MPDTSTPTPSLPGNPAAGAAMDRRVGRLPRARLRRWLLPTLIVLAVAAASGAALLVPRSGTLAVSVDEINSALALSAPF